MKEKEKQWHAVPLKGKNSSPTINTSSILRAEFGLQIVGYLEPKPGIPPSAAHIEELIQYMKKDKPAGILISPVYSLKEAESLSAKTGVKVIVLPHDVGSMPGTDDLILLHGQSDQSP